MGHNRAGDNHRRRNRRHVRNELARLRLYYRVLWDDRLIIGWRRGQVPNSTHEGGTGLPDAWVSTWDKSRSTRWWEYPPKVKMGAVVAHFHPRGLRTFLMLAQQKPIDQFTRLEKKQCLELAGVCAFRFPQGAYNYAIVNPDGVEIAEFYGKRICDCHEGFLSDDERLHSDVVEVVRRMATFSLQKFMELHRAEITIAAPQAVEVTAERGELPFDGYDEPYADL